MVDAGAARRTDLPDLLHRRHGGRGLWRKHQRLADAPVGHAGVRARWPQRRRDHGHLLRGRDAHGYPTARASSSAARANSGADTRAAGRSGSHAYAAAGTCARAGRRPGRPSCTAASEASHDARMRASRREAADAVGPLSVGPRRVATWRALERAIEALAAWAA